MGPESVAVDAILSQLECVLLTGFGECQCGAPLRLFYYQGFN